MHYELCGMVWLYAPSGERMYPTYSKKRGGFCAARRGRDGIHFLPERS